MTEIPNHWKELFEENENLDSGLVVRFPAEYSNQISRLAKRYRISRAKVVRTIVGGFMTGRYTIEGAVTLPDGTTDEGNYTSIQCPSCGSGALDRWYDDDGHDAVQVRVPHGGCEDLIHIGYMCMNCDEEPTLVIHNHKGVLRIGWIKSDKSTTGVIETKDF